LGAPEVILRLSTRVDRNNEARQLREARLTAAVERIAPLDLSHWTLPTWASRRYLCISHQPMMKASRMHLRTLHLWTDNRFPVSNVQSHSNLSILKDYDLYLHQALLCFQRLEDCRVSALLKQRLSSPGDQLLCSPRLYMKGMKLDERDLEFDLCSLLINLFDFVFTEALWRSVSFLFTVGLTKIVS
jgi:hypothetical protein